LCQWLNELAECRAELAEWRPECLECLECLDPKECRSERFTWCVPECLPECLESKERFAECFAECLPECLESKERFAECFAECLEPDDLDPKEAEPLPKCLAFERLFERGLALPPDTGSRRGEADSSRDGFGVVM